MSTETPDDPPIEESSAEPGGASEHSASGDAPDEAHPDAVPGEAEVLGEAAEEPTSVRPEEMGRRFLERATGDGEADDEDLPEEEKGLDVIDNP
jgi:hypothetical protein